jgi:hypothetical protein
MMNTRIWRLIRLVPWIVLSVWVGFHFFRQTETIPKPIEAEDQRVSTLAESANPVLVEGAVLDVADSFGSLIEFKHLAQKAQSGDPIDQSPGGWDRQRFEDAEFELDSTLRFLNVEELALRLEQVVRDEGGEVLEVRRGLLSRWLTLDASGAAAWVEGLPEGPSRDRILGELGILWVNVDMPSVMAWVEALPDGDSKHRVMTGIAYESIGKDPVAALELANELPPSDSRDSLLSQTLREWASVDALAATDYANSVTDESMRQRMVAAAALGMAENNSRSAATLAATQLTGGEEQDRTVVSILQRWVQTSPTEATGWIEGFPDTPLRSTATRNLVRIWNSQDPQVARHWIESLPEGTLKADALSALELGAITP